MKVLTKIKQWFHFHYLGGDTQFWSNQVSECFGYSKACKDLDCPLNRNYECISDKCIRHWKPQS